MIGVEAAALAGWPLAALACAGLLALRHRLGLHAVRVAEASHELRGPLTVARLALEGVGGDARRSAAIELELRRAGLALDDLAGAGGDRLARPELVDMGVLLAEAVESWRSLAGAFGATLALDAAPDLLVRADRLRLAQALGNLVANAVEHGGGAVVLRAAATPDGVRVEVTDGGAGLPVAVAATLVPEATRASLRGRLRRTLRVSPHRAAPPSLRGWFRAAPRVSPRGHGLRIAARVARLHGGRLAALPAERGARLVLELPWAR